MIVDDSRIIRKKIERECGDSKFKVVGTASDGSIAIDLFKRVSPEVVTMDLTMPHLDGIECIRKLISLQPDLRILVVSALNDKETGIEAIEEGAIGFITKPFSAEKLHSALVEITEDEF